MEAKVDTLCLLAQPKEGQQQFKNKQTKKTELTENRTVWMSNNQEDKEATFTQIGKRGGDGQPGRKDSQQGGGWRPSEVADCGAGWAKLQVVGEAAAGGPGDRTRNPEFQCGKIKPQTTD